MSSPSAVSPATGIRRRMGPWNFLLLWLLSIPCNGLAQSPPPICIVVLGDSTVCNYPAGGTVHGWGEYLGSHFAPGVTVMNLAKAGASTKTFLSLTNYQQALTAKPDFLLIQFGHNDSHPPAQPEATAADGDYTGNLRTYVTAARTAGSKPIFVTPMHRMVFDRQGAMTRELRPYADAMKKVAAEMNVPVIDLYADSGALFEKIGDAGVQTLMTGPQDRTHFNQKGAEAMASLVVGRIGACDERLKGALAAGEPKPPLP